MAELLKDISVTQLQELLEAHSKATEERILVEVCSFVDILERQLNEMIEMQKQMLVNQETIILQLQKNGESVSTQQQDLVEGMHNKTEEMQARHYVLRHELSMTRGVIRNKAAQIVKDFQYYGKEALNSVTEFLGIKKSLVKMKVGIHKSMEDAKHMVERIEGFELGMRRAKQQRANAFRVLADKETVDYSKRDQKSFLLEPAVKPWKRLGEFFEGIEKYISQAINSVDKLEKEVSLKRQEREGINQQETDKSPIQEPQVAATASGEKESEPQAAAIAPKEKKAEPQAVATAPVERKSELQAAATDPRRRESEPQIAATASGEKESEPQAVAIAPKEKESEPQAAATALRGTESEPQAVATASMERKSEPQAAATALRGTESEPQMAATAPVEKKSEPQAAAIAPVEKESEPQPMRAASLKRKGR